MESTSERKESQDATGARVVKRYANRKLYDTRESRYVTLNQIAEFVRAGQDVRIIDNKSKEDLTDITLAQIIYEEQKNKADGQARPLEMLRGLITQSGERLMTSLRDGPMGKLVRKDQEQSQEQREREERAQARKSLIAQSREALDDLQKMADDRMRSMVGRAADQVQQLHAEIARLSARVEELEGRLRRASRREEADGAPKTPENP